MDKGKYPIVSLTFSVTLRVALIVDFLGGPEVQNLSANTGDMGSIPGSRRSPGEGNGNPLQCSYMGNPMDRGA